ncbi:hypothetical protein [Chromobacterium violaceum]|uniref:hypothetical protein n=1 Tax=Chromobacterium violaceum TaxID=536 RepID=UPI00143CE8A4|nr:hypothetical protein [Chromobacterium violaceum]QIY81504.1 hypothetical protein FOB43_21055 [Chromobacterium violaceum]
MAFGANTTGDTVFITIDTPYGPLKLKVASFHATPKYDTVSVTPLNSEHEEASTPKGWDLEIEAIRTDATLDNFCAQWEADFYAGSPTMAMKNWVTETTRETDGSTTTFKYPANQLRLVDPGKRESGKPIIMKLATTASRRLKQ